MYMCIIMHAPVHVHVHATVHVLLNIVHDSVQLELYYHPPSDHLIHSTLLRPMHINHDNHDEHP